MRRRPRQPCRWRLLALLAAVAVAWLWLLALGLGWGSVPALSSPPTSESSPSPSFVSIGRDLPLAEPPPPSSSSSSSIQQQQQPPHRVIPQLSPQPESVHLMEMQMDPENRWVPIPPERLAWLERDGTTPLARDCGEATTVVAFHNGKYGGFTADMGWALMVSMYAAETKDTCPEFSSAWGHGCDNKQPARWTCFFKPVSEGAKVERKGKTVNLDSGSQPTRRRVRRDHVFTPEFKGKHRYPRLAELAGPCVGPTSDLLAWRLVFRWTFRVNDLVRSKIDALRQKIVLPARYAGVHIRLGDKVGLRPGPREASPGTYEVNDYAIKLKLYYGENLPEVVFVASDDYNAAMLLGEQLGVKVVTTAEPHRDKGFSITEYRTNWTDQQKFDAAVRLWADMEVLAEADCFLGTFQSNVDRTIHLMRFDKPGNTTLAVDRFGHSRCSQRARENQLGSHNFWLCA